MTPDQTQTSHKQSASLSKIRESKKESPAKPEANSAGDQKTLKEILKPSYEQRAKIKSLLFDDHSLQISDVYFTIDESIEMRAKEVKEGDEKKTEQQSDKTPQKTTATVAEIFTPVIDPKKPAENKLEDNKEEKTVPPSIRRVLIVGKPGSGKTTLSKCIAQQWIQGGEAKQEGMSTRTGWSVRYDQVFWVTLRDLHDFANSSMLQDCANSPLTLAAFIHLMCIKHYDPKNEHFKNVGILRIQHVLRTQPQRTLLILDGFDEIRELFVKNPQVKTLVNLALNPSCDLIVTGRDYGLPPPEVQFDRRLTNQGYTDDQVMKYIDSYFDSLPTKKSDPNFKEQVKKTVKGDYRLWAHAHTPLLLLLICESYRQLMQQGKKPTELSLLDLYQNNLEVFIRRYLEWAYKGSEHEKSNLKDKTLEQLVDLCRVEIGFLQELSFEAITRNPAVQRFDAALKDQVITRIKDRPGVILWDGYFESALNLGFLDQLPGGERSLLKKTHEFSHLTFQDYFAGRHIVAQLKRYNKDAYKWLRENKYNPKYREALNFICMMMAPHHEHEYEEFWKVLLDERTDLTDLTGVSYLQLAMYSLEAVQCNVNVPGIKGHLKNIHDAILKSTEEKFFNQMFWLHTAIVRCPSIAQADPLIDTRRKQLLNKSAFGLRERLKDKPDHDQLKRLLIEIKNKEKQIGAFNILEKIYIQQAKLLSVIELGMLLKGLLELAKDRSAHLDEIRSNVFKACAELAEFVTPTERSELLKELMVLSKDKQFQKDVVDALKICAAQAGLYTAIERSALLQKILGLVKDKEVLKKESEIRQFEDDLFPYLGHDYQSKQLSNALSRYVGQAEKFSPTERSELLKILLTTAKDKEMNGLLGALKAGVELAKFVTPTERSELLKELLGLIKDKGRRKEAFKALKNYALEAGAFTPTDRSELFKALLALVKNNEMRKEAFNMLECYASQAGAFTTEERDELFNELMVLIKDKTIQKEAIGLLQGNVYQPASGAFITFTPTQRGILFNEVIILVKNKDAQEEALKTLHRYIYHAEELTSIERGILFKELMVLVKDKNALNQLSSVISQFARLAAAFTPRERDELLKEILILAEKKLTVLTGKLDRETKDVLEILEAYTVQLRKFPDDERVKVSSQVLSFVSKNRNLVHKNPENFSPPYGRESLAARLDEALLACVGYGGRYTPNADRKQIFGMFFYTQVDMINGVNWLAAELLGVPYTSSYSTLEGMIKQGKLLAATPLQQLLEVYFKDTANNEANTAPRSELWLQIVVRRAVLEGVTFVEVGNELRLYGAREQALQSVSIAGVKGTPKLKTLYAKLKVSLALSLSTTTVALPDEKQQDSHVEIVTLRREIYGVKVQLEEKLEETRVEMLTRMEALKVDLISRFDPAIQSLETRINEHQSAIDQQREAISTLQGSVMQIHGKVATVLSTLSQQQDQIKKCEELAKEITAWKERIDKDEKRNEEKYEKQAKELYEQQRKLEVHMQKIKDNVDKLKKEDAHDAKLIKELMEKQEKLTKQYEEGQKRLAERDALMQDPKLAKFYRGMYTHLIGFFLACTTARSSLIKIQPDPSLKEKILKVFLKCVGKIPVPGLDAAMTFINGMIEWYNEKREKEGRERAMSNAPIGLTEQERMIEDITRETICRYVQHIKIIKTDEDISNLADFAVRKIITGTSQPSNMSDSEAKTIDVKGAVEKNYILCMVNYLHQELDLKEVNSPMVKAVDGRVNKMIKWDANSIFQHTGIWSEKHYYYSVDDKTKKKGAVKCLYKEYGFRVIKDDVLAASVATKQEFKAYGTLPEGSFVFTQEVTQVAQLIVVFGSLAVHSGKEAIAAGGSAVLESDSEELYKLGGQFMAGQINLVEGAKQAVASLTNN